MIDVTVVLLDGGLPTTSMAPIEIFSYAGVLWSMLHGQQPQPLFLCVPRRSTGARRATNCRCRSSPMPPSMTSTRRT